MSSVTTSWASSSTNTAGIELLVQKMVLTGKPPAHDEVVAIMTMKSGILARKAAIARVIGGIESLMATFDEGIGELEEE